LALGLTGVSLGGAIPESWPDRLFLTLAEGADAASAEIPRPTVVAVPGTAPRLDGRLDDEA
jgi:hypothetical protein